MKRKSLVWFKTDLRVRDNETLWQAVQHSESAIFLYCIDPELWESTQFGFYRIGFHRTKFLLESLQDLDRQLRALGGNLIIRIGKPQIIIPTLVNKYGINAVYAKKEIAYEEQNLNLEVEKEVWKLSCTFETYSTSTLYKAADMPFSIKEIPDQFTTFRKAIEVDSIIRPESESPNNLQSIVQEDTDWSQIYEELYSKFPTMPEPLFPFKGGESQAWSRLQNYFFADRKILTYKETRNQLIGTEFSTRFSPWLALGCISPKTIYFQLKEFENSQGGNDSTYWMYFELLWRDFFRFMFKKHKNKYFLPNGIKSRKINIGKADIFKITKWVNGETSDDFINACMRELKYTGFMSNRGRQNVASYFCHDLQLDWRYGASYFESQLVDYDVSNNWGNWAYQAGVGNDPMKIRKFNTENQAREYDPNMEYRHTWLK